MSRASCNKKLSAKDNEATALVSLAIFCHDLHRSRIYGTAPMGTLVSTSHGNQDWKHRPRLEVICGLDFTDRSDSTRPDTLGNEDAIARNDALPEGHAKSRSADAPGSGLPRGSASSPSPVLLVVAGRIAAGKSTIARGLAAQLNATLLVADRTRERVLAELARSTSHEAALRLNLQPGFADAIYAELFRRAREELAAGRSVVLDAAFPQRALRRAALELARELRARFLLVECRADDEVLRDRLAARAIAAGVTPETWLPVVDEFAQAWQSIDEVSERSHLVLDTSGAPERGLNAAREWLAQVLAATPAGEELRK